MLTSRMQKTFFGSLLLIGALVGLSGHAQAQAVLRITEVMSSSGTGGTPDWFELTNYGNESANLAGFKVDDNSFALASAANLTGISSIAPGEKVLFVETSSPETILPTYRTFWGGLVGVQIGSYSGSGLSLSSGGDGLVIYNASGAEISRVTFGAATTGATFYWAYEPGGAMATSFTGTLSAVGTEGAFSSSGTPVNTGSPGLAVTAASIPNLNWANGSSLGGTGTWNAGNVNWSAATSPISGVPWASGKRATFAGTAGTVTLASHQMAKELVLDVSGYALTNSSPGIGLTLEDGGVNLPGAGSTTTLALPLAGTNGLKVARGGTLVLNAAQSYTGDTAVVGSTLRLDLSGSLPSASILSIGSLGVVELNGRNTAVAGLGGLGSLTMGAANLTVAIAGTSDVEFNGDISGSGDFIVDSPGTGIQKLATRASTSGSLKDYSGKTIIRRGGLGMTILGAPVSTSEILVETNGTLIFLENGLIHTVQSPAFPLQLLGGALGQRPDEDAATDNLVRVVTSGKIRIANTLTTNPVSTSVEEFSLLGPLEGDASAILTLEASQTVPGADTGRVEFKSTAGNSFAGLVVVQTNMIARVQGDYPDTSLQLVFTNARLDGSGKVKAVEGLGLVSPRGVNVVVGTNSVDVDQGILTVGQVNPAAGLAFAFEMKTNAPHWNTPAASENDVLHLTHATPFTTALTSSNRIQFFLSVSNVAAGDVFQGGFFTAQDSLSQIQNATVEVFWLGDGTVTNQVFGGLPYRNLGSSLQATLGSTPANGGYVTVLTLSSNSLPPAPYDATFASWATAAGQGSIAMGSDADGNGLTALLEYAYGAAVPGSISRVLLPANGTTNIGGTNYLVLNYFARTNGVAVTPEVSAALATNGWSTNGVNNIVVGIVTTNNTTLEQRRATVPVDDTRKFLRLKATSP